MSWKRITKPLGSAVAHHICPRNKPRASYDFTLESDLGRRNVQREKKQSLAGRKVYAGC